MRDNQTEVDGARWAAIAPNLPTDDLLDTTARRIRMQAVTTRGLPQMMASELRGTHASPQAYLEFIAMMYICTYGLEDSSLWSDLA